MSYAVKERFDNLSRIKFNTSPILFIHGKNDDIVPNEHSIRLFDNVCIDQRLLIEDAMIGHEFQDVHAQFYVPLMSFFSKFKIL